MHARRLALSAALGLLVPVLVAPGSQAVPQPVSTPTTPPLVETVTVDARAQNGTQNAVPLQASASYLFEVTGTYRWAAGSEADGECSWTTADPVHRRARHPLFGEGAFDVLVNETVVEWVATAPDGEGCNTTDFTYRYVHHQAQAGPVRLRLADTDYGDNAGAVTVSIFHLGSPAPSTEFVEHVSVPSQSAGDVATTQSLQAGAEYLVRVTGTYSTDPAFPRLNDGECTQVANGPGVRDGFGAATPLDPDDDVFDVYVDGQQVDWQPTRPTPAGCNDTDHTYEVRVTRAAAGPMRFRVHDPYPVDNVGTAEVDVYRITSTAAGPGGVDLRLADQVAVDSRSSTPTSSHVPLEAGRTYVIEAQGTYFWSTGYADPECANNLVDPTWLRDRYEDLFPATDLFDLLVDEQTVEWEPTDADVNGCNTADHTYRISYTPARTGLVTFRVNDPYTPDNNGVVQVRILLGEVPVGGVVVNPRDPAGVPSPPLVAGRSYRLVASQAYNPAFPLGWQADAECSRDPGGVFLPHRDLDPRAPADDILDLYVGGEQVTWTPVNSTGPCDPDHEYELVVVAAATGPVNLAVFDTIPEDNVGLLAVQVFEQPR